MKAQNRRKQCVKGKAKELEIVNPRILLQVQHITVISP